MLIARTGLPFVIIERNQSRQLEYCICRTAKLTHRRRMDYNFGHFDDDVAKEGGDLAGEASFATSEGASLTTNTQSAVLSNQELADISQVCACDVRNWCAQRRDSFKNEITTKRTKPRQNKRFCCVFLRTKILCWGRNPGCLLLLPIEALRTPGLIPIQVNERLPQRRADGWREPTLGCVSHPTPYCKHNRSSSR